MLTKELQNQLTKAVAKGDVNKGPAGEFIGLLNGTTGSGTKAGTGVTQESYSVGQLHVERLTFVNTPIVLADNAGVVAYGGLKVFDFPVGLITIFGATLDLALTKSSAGVNDTWDGDIAVGTVTATNAAAPMLTTQANIIPNTATPQAVGGVTTGDAVSVVAAPAALTDSSSGTDDGTIEALPNPTDAPASADALREDLVAVHWPILRNWAASFSARINSLAAGMSGGMMAVLDGTSAGPDMYINVKVDDADHDVTGTAANIILNGTMMFIWANASVNAATPKNLN